MRQSDRPFIIGITGGIASGKSVALDVFRKTGIPVWEADKIGHETLRKKEVTSMLTAAFGQNIATLGKIDRNKLAALVFENDEKRKKLNSLLHPIILNEMQNIVENCQSSFLVFEVPLLFEENMESCFDLIIHIYCSQSLQIERLQKRNSFSREEAEKRIFSQMDSLLKMQKSDISIENSGSVKQLKMAIHPIIAALPTYSKKTINPFSQLTNSQNS
jgi:dephospho-CoA kinase